MFGFCVAHPAALASSDTAVKFAVRLAKSEQRQLHANLLVGPLFLRHEFG